MIEHDTARSDGDPDQGQRSSLAPDVSALTQAVTDAFQRSRAAGSTSPLEAVEGAARALVRRVVSSALADPRPVGDRRRLAKALSGRSGGPSLGGASAAAVGTRVARRLGPARFAARRTPLWFAVTAVPAVYSSITRGAEELTLVASHLILRARAAGVEPDPERLRRVVVQVVSGHAIQPEDEPSHGPLALAWGRRAVRAAMPFARGVRTKDPDSIAAAAAAVDPSVLRRSATSG